MSEHTKGTLKLWTSNSHIRIGSDDIDGNVVCATYAKDGLPVLAVKEGDARRLVACWNACAGISTEMLESVGHIVAPAVIHQKELTGQRDELVATVEDFILDYRNGLGPDIQRLSDAVAKVRA